LNYNQYNIDAWRFKIRIKKKSWKTHPNMEMLSLTDGEVGVLDTQVGKESLIIIPDGPNVIEHYFELVEKLGKFYRLVIFDLYGFGYSVHNGNYDYSFARTNLLIEELLVRLKVERPSLAFPCANGFYGLAFARSFPEKINHLFLIQTPSLEEMLKWADRIVPSYLKKPFFSQMLMPFVEKKFAHRWYDYALPKGADREPYQKIALKGLDGGGNFCLCSLTQGLLSQEGEQLELDSTIATTLIHGDIDFTHRGTDFDSIRAYSKSAEVIQFENCGHFPDLEKKKQFIQVVKDRV